MATDLYEDAFTMAHILERLGGIEPSRVLMKPTPGKATEEDLLRYMDRTGRLCELVDGTLVEKPMGFKEGSLAADLIEYIAPFVRKHQLGKVMAPDTTMRLMKGLVRLPDVSFLRRERFPGGLLPAEAIPDIAPDLAIEVLSASNTKGEIERKLKEYFLAGTMLAWIVDPAARTVKVHTAPDTFTELDEDGTLDGGPLLPGFTLPVRTLFQDLPPPKKKPRSKPKKKS